MQPRSNGSPSLDRDAVLTVGLTVAVLILTLGTALLPPLRRVLRAARTPTAAPADPGPWLLVPGKRLLDNRPDADFVARLRAAAALAHQYPNCTILILGGITATASISEAAAGARFLRSLPEGPALKVRQESHSKDTLTNLRNAREMLGGGRTGAGVPVTLVSNRYHLARIGLIASSLGIEYRFRPAEATLDRGLGAWCRFLGEAFYGLWFEVGKGWACLTRNRRMLDRVT